MKCEEVQNLLLQSEMNQAPDGVVLRFSGGAAQMTAEHVAGHVNECAVCGQLARKLRRLDKAVRSLPEPPGSSDALTRFEARLRSMNLGPAPLSLPQASPVSAPVRARKPRIKTSLLWRIADSRLTAAALLLLVIGGSIWAYQFRQNQVLASAQTIEVIVEWNLRLVQSEIPAERRQVYAASRRLASDYVNAASLSEDDRRDADKLIRKSAFLADHVDPLAEADHFSEVADMLVNKMDLAVGSSDGTLGQLSQTYLSVVNQGIERNLDRVNPESLKSDAAQVHLARIEQRNLMLIDKVEALIQKGADHGNPTLRKAVEKQKQKTQQRKVPNGAR